MDTLVSLAIRFPLSGLVGDLHPLDITHAEHTKKTLTPNSVSVFFYSYSTLLVSDADRDAVHVVLSEWLNAATLAVGSDAACRNAILLHQCQN